MENSRPVDKAKQKIRSVSSQRLSRDERIEEAIELAAIILEESSTLSSVSERHQQAQLARMMNDPKGKAFTMLMTDECFRSSDAKRSANQLLFLIKRLGLPGYLTFEKRMGLKVFKLFGNRLYKLFVPLLKTMMRRETASVILPGEETALKVHMQKRRSEGVRINLNHLGEAILGENEAEKRLQIYLQDLKNPEIEYISVKISTIYSQINLLAWNETVGILAERLKELYRTASAFLYHKPDGRVVQKFVNLDMEEYKDLHLTVDLFKRVLDEPEFFQYSAGIVLQSYLPDSFKIQQELTEWAMERMGKGGAAIKIRIVKGANLGMEQVEASLRGWPQAPYTKKSDCDANYKRMVTYGCEPDHAKAANLGVASHNLFDIAYALLLRAENNVKEYVGFEMLEGMADPIRRAVQKLTEDMLLYCPVATYDEFQYAVAYLIRRLDENTAPENFLRHIFEMRQGSKAWIHQAELFSQAAREAPSVYSTPRKTQNRLTECHECRPCAPFENVPDTDWSLKSNRRWGENILQQWHQRKIATIPLVIEGRHILTPAKAGGEDPSIPGKSFYSYSLADDMHIEQALNAAKKVKDSPEKMSVAERSLLLLKIADGLRRQRGDLIGAMVADVGKTIAEADVEVSEAIDFADYYSRNIEEITGLQDLSWSPKGTILVVPPWNFPCSIAAGGILASLAAGNAVIFKPAPEAVLTGWILAQVIWEAGAKGDVFQFITCRDEPEGSRLVKDPRVDGVILTGATTTAMLFLTMRPGLDLMAETGGKNAIIVTSMADRDLAIKEIIQSAFGFSGQKCSACSLAILEAEVYDDPHFLEQLRDAAASLPLGSPWRLSSKVNPLIHEPNPTLLRGLTVLDEGEEWLLKPKQDSGNSNLWSPGIKKGIKVGSFSYQNEFFGPVLSLMRADDLSDALEIANGTPYGLTSGLQSLDEREWSKWLEGIVAGNCYINRGITGAIVQRQPFGGCKDSSFGPGAKAGGPNYLMQLMKPIQMQLPREQAPLDAPVGKFSLLIDAAELTDEERTLWKASAGSYAFYRLHYFSKDHDPSLVLGEDNFLRYRPHLHQTLRFKADDAQIDLFRGIAAAATVGALMVVSLDPSLKSKISPNEITALFPEMQWIIETEETFIARVKAEKLQRIRYYSNPSQEFMKAAAYAGCSYLAAPPLANGRVELLRYLREISISIAYHRYGNLGLREGENRKPLAAADIDCVCGGKCV